jgi:hypothetical protein
MTGHEEILLLDGLGVDPLPVLATRILSRAVTELGPAPVDDEVIRALSVGDREALLWHLRRATLGEPLDATADCTACGEKLDLHLGVEDLLQPGYQEWPERYSETIDGHDVTFRVPNGADQEHLASLVEGDTATATRALLERCVRSVDEAEPEASILLALEEALSQRMGELDPQAEALIATRCAACDAPLEASLDATGYVFEEIGSRSRHLFREVHVLAATYHWSEADILAMTTSRRRIYLDLIDEARSGEDFL